MCSMWLDGLDGITRHLSDHAAFVVAAPAPVPDLRAWALHRRWRQLRLVSTLGTAFASDLGLVDPTWGGLRPAISVLAVEPDGTVRHRYTAQACLGDSDERGLDLLSPVWQLLDLLPSGRGHWYPDNAPPAAQ